MPSIPTMKSRSSPRSKQRGVFINPWCFKHRVRVRVESVLVTGCDDIITLSAAVLGNSINRTYEWTQLSGALVIWLEDRFQSDVMFRQPALRDDKIFRFYMDRGLSTEITKDVLVTSVSKEDVRFDSISDGGATLTGFVASEGGTNLRAMPGFSDYGLVVINNPKKIIAWDNPGGSSFSFNSLQEYGSSPATYDVGKANYYENIKPLTTYKVKTTLDFFGVIREVLSTSFSYAQSPSIVDMAISDITAFTGISVKANISVLEVFTRELRPLTIDEDIVNLSSISSGGVGIRINEVITRELYPLTIDEDIVNLSPISSLSAQLKILEIMNIGLTTIG